MKRVLVKRDTHCDKCNRKIPADAEAMKTVYDMHVSDWGADFFVEFLCTGCARKKINLKINNLRKKIEDLKQLGAAFK